ncbi:YopX domain protein, partial [Streptococcus sp. SR1]
LKPHDDRWVVDYMCNFSSEESFEVVSNIYENPEILEVEE